MDALVYLAMIGSSRVFEAQAMHANNIANVSTHGFKSDRVQFASLFTLSPNEIYHRTPELDPGLVDFKAGSLMSTGRSLDVAINGEGFFVVQTPEGTEAYTRNGNFKIDENGTLRNSDNLVVMGDGGEITLTTQDVAIGLDGTISTQNRENGKQTSVLVDRLKLVNPAKTSLLRTQQGLFVTREGGAEPDSTVHLASGFLESSNVNVVGEMTDMIAIARLYEIHLKLMSVAEENNKVSNNIMNS